VTINVLHDLVNVHLLHVVTTNSERERLAGAVFEVMNGGAISLTHLSGEITVVVVVSVRSPVLDVSVADTRVSETLLAARKSCSWLLRATKELALGIVAGHGIVLLRRAESRTL